MESDNVEETETIIVGGGQAGLSVGRFLKECNRPFVILEKNEKIGVSWARRYDSLVLDSFAEYTRLDSFPFPGDPWRHPRKGDVVEYLKLFAERFDLKPQFSTEVLRVEKKGDIFIVQTNRGVYMSRSIVLATGPFSKTSVPEFSRNIPKNIFQIHSIDYKNPGILQEGSALVVGRGNSGIEIAQELARSGREVFFSFRGKLKSVRSTHLSQWLAYRLGLAHIPKSTLLGKLILWYTKGKAVGMESKLFVQNPNIHLVGECTDVQGEEIICKKEKISPKNIVWATGYESDFSIISIPDFDLDSQIRGVTNILGLYLLNIRWQYSKSSSHLAGVSRDAKYIAKDIIDKSGI